MILLLLLKKVGNGTQRESAIHPITPMTSALTIRIHRKKEEKWKSVEDEKGCEQLRPIKKHWLCS